MNVGMTRARRKLLLVGDSSTLCRHSFFGELLAYVKEVGGYRTVNEMAKDLRKSQHLNFVQTLNFRPLVREPYGDSYIKSNLDFVPLVAALGRGVVHEDLFRKLSNR